MNEEIDTEEKTLKQSDFKHSWGEIIQFIDGWGFGITPTGDTVCLGKESVVREALKDPTKSTNDPIVNDIIKLEIELQEELGHGNKPDSTTRKSPLDKRHYGTKRGGLMLRSQHHQTNRRYFTQRTRTPLRKNNQGG